MGLFRRKNKDPLDPANLAEHLREGVPSGFGFTVEDVFTITGRGTVVTGTIGSGMITTGARLRLVRTDGSNRDVTVTGIDVSGRISDSATAGQAAGLLIPELKRSDIGPGDLLSG